MRSIGRSLSIIITPRPFSTRCASCQTFGSIFWNTFVSLSTRIIRSNLKTVLVLILVTFIFDFVARLRFDACSTLQTHLNIFSLLHQTRSEQRPTLAILTNFNLCRNVHVNKKHKKKHSLYVDNLLTATSSTLRQRFFSSIWWECVSVIRLINDSQFMFNCQHLIADDLVSNQSWLVNYSNYAIQSIIIDDHWSARSVAACAPLRESRLK